MTFNVNKFDVAKFDSILARGLSHGMGKAGQQVCIEAAICETLGLVHSDDPKCVAASVRIFKITLNDSDWSSPEARAKGLRDLGLAQLGSLNVVDDAAFVSLLSKKIIGKLLPRLFRTVFPDNALCLNAADYCEREQTEEAAARAAEAAEAARAAGARAAAETMWAAARAAEAARQAARGAEPVVKTDNYLILAADLALETLRELNSPGIALLEAA